MPVIGNAGPAWLVAEQILWLRNKMGLETTPMHVIKLAYLCHGWMLGIFGQCLSAEPAEAWRYGPVIPSVYHNYKEFRNTPITRDVSDRSGEFDENQNSIIEGVIDSYLHYDPWQLSAITHQPGTPWDIVYGDGRGEGETIPDEVIEKYYRELADR